MMKILFIVNPLSGGKDKKPLLEEISRRLNGRYDSRVVYTERPGHATELARKADTDIVVAVGGDGTVNEVASGLLGTDKVLGIVPTGSGDGLALHLGIGRRLDEALETLNDGIITYMDCGLVDGKPFFCTAGLGLDADVAWRFAVSPTRGLRTYISLALKLWRHYQIQTYTLTIDGEKLVTPAVMVTVGNANQWGNQARITDRASVEDGLLTLAVVKPFRSWEIPFLASKLMDGRAHTSRRVFTRDARKITIERMAPGPIHYDGDPVRKGTRIEFEVVPHALRVLVPKGRKI